MPKRKAIILSLSILLVLLISILISIEQSQHSLTVSKYELSSPKISSSIRIVQLTDLHNAQFGEDNCQLLALVKAQKPDLILFTGDLVTQDEENTSTAVSLIQEMCDIATVYVSLGNHEISHEAQFGSGIFSLYEAAGAIVFQQEYADIEINSQPIRIGGLYGYCLPEMWLSTGEANQDECDFLKDFQDTDRLTVLLSHNPTGWLINGSLDAWEADCVFAGHAHGGQIILPFIGGVFAPDLGWFPGKLEGLYSSADGTKTLVLSRGLGSSIEIPRINNIPEIVVVDLVPTE